MVGVLVSVRAAYEIAQTRLRRAHDFLDTKRPDFVTGGDVTASPRRFQLQAANFAQEINLRDKQNF
jgi:hypothetical protein